MVHTVLMLSENVHLALQVHLSSDCVRHPLLLLFLLPQAALLHLQRAFQSLQLSLQHNTTTALATCYTRTHTPVSSYELFQVVIISM